MKTSFLFILLAININISFALPLKIIVFDVGQGNAAYIQSPIGMNAVIDAGPSNTVGRRIWGFVRDSRTETY